MTINYIALFCLVDDLYKIMIKDDDKSKKSTRQSSLSIPEIITTSHKVFESLAKIGKSSNDKWFLGFKLHVITNDKREIINILITQGNIDDREHVEDLSKDLKGRICGDRGYISKKLFEKLYSKGLKMITYLKSNMQNKLMEYRDKIMLRKRSSVIEGLFNILKNKFGLAHTRHRSVSGGFIHIISVLIAYMMS